MINLDVIGRATGILVRRYRIAVMTALDRLARAFRRDGRAPANLAGRLVDGEPDEAAGRCRSVSPSCLPAGEAAVGLHVTRNRATAAVVVVSACGEVDARTAPELAAALREACVTTPVPDLLVIDLTGVRFFSAAGLTVLLATQNHCRERHIGLRIVATHRSVLRPLQITGLDREFDLTPSLRQAIHPQRDVSGVVGWGRIA